MIAKNKIIEIANLIKDLPSYQNMDGNHVVDVEDIVQAFCGMLRKENPRFMEQRFRDYIAGKCGPNGGKVK